MITDETVPNDEKDVKRIPTFRNPNFKHRALIGSKKKVWRSLKQIVAMDKACNWPYDAVSYGNIDAPPSFKPAKKYSDLTGLPALYTDPMTKLRYANAEEFTRIRSLPMDVVGGLLELRKASSIVG